MSPPWWETHLQHRYRMRSQTIVSCGNRSGGRQPTVVGNAPATPIPHTVANTRLVPKHEGRSSARRGRGKHVCADASVLVRQTADGVWGNRRCIGVNSSHGGLTPPALVLLRERLSAKKRFLRCTNARSPRSGGREPAVAFGKRACRNAAVKSRETAGRLSADRRCVRVQTYHGGLTPPAPGCTHGYRRRCAVAIRKNVLFHTRG